MRIGNQGQGQASRESVMDLLREECRMDPETGCWVGEGEAKWRESRAGEDLEWPLRLAVCRVFHSGRSADELVNRCGNALCCNPHHMGARKEGGMITTTVRELVARYLLGMEGVAELAERFGVVAGTVRGILDGRTWRHVTGGPVGEPVLPRRRDPRKAGYRRGERVAGARMTEESVRELKRVARGWINGRRPTLARLSEMFGIAPSTISDILRGKQWRHVE